VSEQKPFGYSAITEQEERLNDDPACSDPMCSYRAEAHRIPELEAEIERLRELIHRTSHRAVQPMDKCRQCAALRVDDNPAR
jgi:hypothetical protein